MRDESRDGSLILRSVAWDGADPQAGDVVMLPGGDAVVVELAARGPGVGQWRLECRETRIIRWTES